MQFSLPAKIVPEAARILSVSRQQCGEHVDAVTINRFPRIDSFLDSVEPEIGERRTLPLLVRENFGGGLVVDGNQMNLIEEGGLAQFFREPNLEAAAHRLKRAGRNLNVFVVIDRKVSSVAGACT